MVYKYNVLFPNGKRLSAYYENDKPIANSQGTLNYDQDGNKCTDEGIMSSDQRLSGTGKRKQGDLVIGDFTDGEINAQN